MNQKITLPEVAEWIARRRGNSKREVELFLREMASLTAETLASGETLKIDGLGLFKPVWVEARTSVNVQTGEPFVVSGHYKLVFTPEKRVRETINEPFSCFSAEALPDDADLSTLRTAESAQPDDETDDFDDEDGSEKTDLSINDTTVAVETDIPSPDMASESDDVVEQSVEPVASCCGQEGTAQPVEDETLPDGETELEPQEQAAASESEDIAEQPIEPITLSQEQKDNDNEPEAETKAASDGDLSDTSHEDITDLLRRERMRGFWMGAVIAATITACVLFSVYVAVYRPFVSAEEVPALADKQVTVPSTTTDTVEDVSAVSGGKGSVQVDSADSKSLTAEQQAVVEVVKDTLGKGEFLTTLSLRHYGHKAFWVYIYDANKDIIANPDNVEAGIVLTIPSREEYGIEATDTASINKALGIADSLKSKR